MALRMPAGLIGEMDSLAMEMTITDEDGNVVRNATRSEAIRAACMFLLANRNEWFVKYRHFKL